MLLRNFESRQSRKRGVVLGLPDFDRTERCVGAIGQLLVYKVRERRMGVWVCLLPSEWRLDIVMTWSTCTWTSVCPLVCIRSLTTLSLSRSLVRLLLYFFPVEFLTSRSINCFPQILFQVLPSVKSITKGRLTCVPTLLSVTSD